MYETGFPYVTSETVKRCPGGRSTSTSAVHIKVEAAGRQQQQQQGSSNPATAEDGWTPGCTGYRYPTLQQTDSGQAVIGSAETPRSYPENPPTGSNSKSPEGNTPSGTKPGPSVPTPTIGETTPPMQQQQQHQQHQQHAAFGPFRDRYQSAFSNLTPLLCYEKSAGPGLPPEPVRPTRIPAEPEPISSRGSDKSVVVPADPSLWSPEHVKQWLEWAVREYSLQDVDAGRFTFLGRELCHLSREDFSRLTNPYNGEVLYAHLHFLRQTSETSLPPPPPSVREKTAPAPPSLHGPQSTTNGNKLYQMEANDSHPLKLTKSETTYKGAWSTSPSAQSQAYGPHNTLSGMTKSGLDPHPHIRNMQDPYQVFGPTSSRLASSGSGQIQLWQFLLELLSDSSNANCITWEGTNGEFKLTDPDEVARRWGERKSKPNMNYDKLSRALRYYYDKNIMTKVHGKRYAYKFDFQGLAQATQPAAADPAAYKYQSDLFMPSYHHSPKLNFAAHAAGISSGGVFPSPSSYWSNPSANLYSNIASGHGMPHHAGHVAPHIGSYPHYA